MSAVLELSKDILTQCNMSLILHRNIPCECCPPNPPLVVLCRGRTCPGFFIALAKKLDAVQQNCVIYSRHRKMSFFSTPSFGGYLPEPLVPAFFSGIRDPRHDPPTDSPVFFHRQTSDFHGKLIAVGLVVLAGLAGSTGRQSGRDPQSPHR